MHIYLSIDSEQQIENNNILRSVYNQNILSARSPPAAALENSIFD